MSRVSASRSKQLRVVNGSVLEPHVAGPDVPSEREAARCVAATTSRPLSERKAPDIDKAWALWRKMGEPKNVVAPMVNQSELAFRMLTRKYGADLCFTPMLHAKRFAEVPRYRELMLTWVEEVEVEETEEEVSGMGLQMDRPLFVQFCANDPAALLRAACMVSPMCDAVDINLGCPQNIAKRGRYGAFLLEEKDLIVDLVSTLHEHATVPVTCKIRLLPDMEDTLELARAIQRAGASLLTVHGRTRDQNKQRVGECDFDAIRRIKQELDIPVVANGGIETAEDVQRVLEYTGVDGVMTSEGILGNPRLFEPTMDEPLSTAPYNGLEMAREYLDFANAYAPTTESTIRAHLFKLMYRELSTHTHVRPLLGKDSNFDELLAELLACDARLREENPDEDDVYAAVPSWYRRHPRASKAPAADDTNGEDAASAKPARKEDESEEDEAMGMTGLFGAT